MTPGDFIGYFSMAIMGLILGQLLREATEGYRATKKIREDYRK